MRADLGRAHPLIGAGVLDADAIGSALIEYCAHDMSMTGAEGPAADLGRPVVLWSCDSCGATVLCP
jgi:hypothetical protein